MSVTLKITFNDDLRRVTLPTTTTFDDLKKRLSQMFSDYVLSNRLSYIDDEDDRVTIQTTEELQEAFRLSRGGVLRLFIEENEDDEDADYEELDSDDESDDRVHSAICDNCDERIVGIRYKCGNCADYDLCQSCEKLDGVHDSAHLFIKIRTPLSPWASPVRVLLPNLYPQQQHQQVPCWARRVQQYIQREQCERQRAAQREQYEQQAQRVQQARQQWFEQLRAQRAAQASNGCPRFAGQCGRPASSEQPQCGRPASAEHPFANFFQHLLQQIEALNEREEENNNNTNNTNNNTNTDENIEQPNPFRVVIHFRNNEEQKEEQKEEKTEQQAQPDVTSSEALVEDVVEDAPKQQSYQPEENQPILTDAQPEPSAPVVEEPKQEVVEQAKPVEPSVPVVESLPVEEKPKRELTRFEQLLNTLEDMGFTDRRKNIEVLVRTAGNLEAAVQSLISFEATLC